MTDQEDQKLDNGNTTSENYQGPESPVPSGSGPLQPQESAELASARTLAMVGVIGAPVSLIIGGMALSTVSVVCSIIALAKLRKFAHRPLGAAEAFCNSVRLMAFIGLGVGCGALVINIISVVVLLPLVMEAMTTGDYSAILNGDVQSLLNGGSSSSGSNPWG